MTRPSSLLAGRLLRRRGGVPFAIVKAQKFRQFRSKADDGQGMDLRHAGLSNFERLAHFLHRQFFKVVKRNNLPLPFFKNLEGLGQDGSQFLLQAHEKRIFVRPVRPVREGLLLGGVTVSGGIETSEIQAVQFTEQLLKLLKIHREPRRELRLRRGTSQLPRKGTVGLFDRAGAFAKTAGTPVRGPQTVKDGTANSEFGVSGKMRVFAWIVAVHGFDQADDARMHQVLERNLAGKPVMNALRDVANIRQMIREEPLSLRGIDLRVKRFGAKLGVHGPSYPSSRDLVRM